MLSENVRGDIIYKQSWQLKSTDFVSYASLPINHSSVERDSSIQEFVNFNAHVCVYVSSNVFCIGSCKSYM